MTPTDEELRTSILDFLKENYGSMNRDFPAVIIAVRVLNKNPNFRAPNTRQRIIAAIDFLYDHHQLKKRTEKGSEYFRLSGSAVQEFSPSQYAQQPISPISINNYGVFVNGSNYGQITQNTKEAFEIIDKIVSIISTAEVESEKKMELIANAETIRAQLMSPTPDADSIKKSWNILNGAAQFGAALVTLSPLAIELAHKLSYVANLLPH